MTDKGTDTTVFEYETPEVRDYGDVKDLTATASTGTQTDVPLGTHVPPFSIFS